MAGTWNVQECPVGLATFEGHEKAPMRLGHLCNDQREQRFPGGVKVFDGDTLRRHSFEAPLELFTKRFSRRRKNLDQGTVMA
jgi:hypothetical protein